MAGIVSQTKVHLVLGAGGAKCIGYVGALREIENRGISYASVSACSAGTLIGAFLCSGLTAKDLEEKTAGDLSHLVGKLLLPKPFHLFGLLKWPFARYKNPGYVEFFKKVVQGDPTFKELDIPLSMMGVDIISNRILVYSAEKHPDMPVSEAIRIATAIPSLYPPQVYGDEHIIVDAVFVTHAPIWIPVSYGDHLPIVVIKPKTPTRKRLPSNLASYVVNGYTSGIISRDDYMKQLPAVRMIEIDTDDVRYDEFNMSEQKKDRLIEAGRQEAGRVLGEWGDGLWSIVSPPLALETERNDYSSAVDHAAEIITGYRRKLPRMAREQIFISYSHDDKEWLNRLRNHLEKHPTSRSILLWDDTRIRVGDNWRNAIRTALASAKIAVLMVSEKFLRSTYIDQVELNHLRSAAEKENVKLIWFTLDECEYQKLRLGDIQSARSPDLPLAMLGEPELEAALEEICEQIVEAFHEK